MNKFYAALVAITAVALMVPASAQDVCYTTSAPEVTIPGESTDGITRYVDNDPCQPDCGYSIWIYEEFNGIDGLQRDDEVVSDVTNCDGSVTGDFIVF